MSIRGLIGGRSVFSGVLALILIWSVGRVASADNSVALQRDAALEKHAKLRVLKASIRASLGGQSSVAGYLTIENDGAQDEELVAVTGQAFQRIEIHEHVHSDGMMRMRPVNRVLVPAGNVLAFKSRGLHLMMFSAGAMVAGEHKKLQLQFSSGTVVSVDAVVVPINSGE